MSKDIIELISLTREITLKYPGKLIKWLSRILNYFLDLSIDLDVSLD